MNVFGLSLLFALSCVALADISSGALHVSLRQETRGQENAFERNKKLLDSALVLQESIARQGCATDVCFALDGSASVGETEYRRAKEFAQVIAVISSTDPTARHGAIQFGLSNIGVANLTTNSTKFVTDVGASLFANANRTFTSAGVLGCARILRAGEASLRSSRTVKPNAAFIIVISDGGSNIGVPPRVASELFSDNENVTLLAVAIGNANQDKLKSISQNGNRLVDLTRPSLLLEATKATVNFVCNL